MTVSSIIAKEKIADLDTLPSQPQVGVFKKNLKFAGVNIGKVYSAFAIQTVKGSQDEILTCIGSSKGCIVIEPKYDRCIFIPMGRSKFDLEYFDTDGKLHLTQVETGELQPEVIGSTEDMYSKAKLLPFLKDEQLVNDFRKIYSEILPAYYNTLVQTLQGNPQGLNMWNE